MKIPARVKIAGKTYRIRYDDDERLPDRDIKGCVDYATGTITLSKVDTGSACSREDIEQTYLHEIWHAIWDALGESGMRKDERRADSFCSLLHQVLNSGTGELK